MHIRSFRVVFDLERRIHRIDRFRVPLPYGLPLRSVGYAVIALVAVLVAGRLPILGALLGGLPAPARYALVPVAVSYAFTQLRLDGRTAHAAAGAWLRFSLMPRAWCAFRPLPRRGATRFASLTSVTGTEPRRRRRPVTAGSEAKGQTGPDERSQLELW